MIDWNKAKDAYNIIAYCPKKDEVFLIKDYHSFKGENWFTYADSKLFGKFIKEKNTKTWQVIGRVK